MPAAAIRSRSIKSRRLDRQMHKPKKTKYSITGLVISGLVSVFVGSSLIIRPVPYVSMGGVGQYASIRVMSVFAGNDSAFIGVLILFMGCFILTVAYRIKNPSERERLEDDRSEYLNDRLSDTAGTPWENNQDHTTGRMKRPNKTSHRMPDQPHSSNSNHSPAAGHRWI